MLPILQERAHDRIPVRRPTSSSVITSPSAAVGAALVIVALGAWALAWVIASAAGAREKRAFEARVRDVGEQLTDARIACAAAQAEAASTQRALVELRATLTNRESSIAALRTNEVQLEQALATERQRVESAKTNERDVEARLQRVAKQYVDEARELLVASAADRLGSEAAAFRERVATTVAPLDERLGQLGTSLAALGSERTKDQAHVSILLEALNGKMSGIDDATRRVERVLGSSQARGSWGEFELNRLLEMTGMTEHVSFDVQKSGYGLDGAGRPDVVLRIPGNLNVPIDAKCPFAAYQEAVNATTDSEREPLFGAAVAAVRAHVKALEARRYHQAERCVGWTIMFVPIEAMLSTLFARDRSVFDAALGARILIASPLTLLLYLEAFARGWAAQKQSDNAEMIVHEARKLVERLRYFTDKFDVVGKRLESVLDAYNDSVATYEGRLGPQARRLSELRGDVAEPHSLQERRTNVRRLDPTRLPGQAASPESVTFLPLHPVGTENAERSHESDVG